MKMKIFVNIIRAACGVAKALTAVAAVMLACTAWAGTWYDGSKYTWTYVDYDGGVAIYKSNNDAAIEPLPESGTDLVIPQTIGGKVVKGIGRSALRVCEGMRSVTIPKGVKLIGASAFADCSGLERVSIPDTVTEIYDSAFRGCTSLEDIEIPDSVTSIGNYAFKDCSSLEYIEIPDSVTSIGADAFKGCTSLKEVRLPEGFVYSGVMTDYFSDCPEELEISSVEKVGSLTWHFKVVDGGAEICYNDEDDEATINPSKALGAIEIPQTLGLGGFPVTSIGEEAFMDCNKLTSVTIPPTVTRIGEDAFRDCSSMALTVPDTVVSIGDGAFAGCDAMADNGFVIVRGVLHHYTDKDDNVSIPDGVTRIGRSAFAECDIDSVTIPSSVTNIGAYAFRECKNLETIDVPASVTMIEQGTFWKCDALRDVTIPKSVTSVRVDAFTDTALATVHVEKGDTKRVKELIADSGYDVSKVTFVEPPDVFTVTFNANGGTCAEVTREVEDGSAVGMLPSATLTGFTFDGWFTAADGGDAVDAATVVTADVTFYAHWVSPQTWFTKRADAIAEALRAGKKIFLICGRDTCYNTMTTKNVSCEDPIVKDELAAKCVLWYSNCDTQEDENWDYLPWGSFTLPVVCIIDPKDPDRYLKRTTGGDHGGPLSAADVLAFIADVPYPAGADPAASGAGSTPSGGAGYVFLPTDNITAPYSAAKTLYGAVYNGSVVVGVVELKLGRINARKGTSRVSGAVTLLDGKRYTIKGQTAAVSATAPLVVSLEVKKVGTMTVTIGGDKFAGSLGSWHVQTANVGGNWNSAPTVSVDASDLSMIPGTVLDALLPNDEKGVSSGTRWTFAKATSVKWAKPKVGETPVVMDSASGKGLIVDTSKGRTNLSGMKITYTPKKGTFKGTFKVYALEGSGAPTKLKKYTIKVGGVVVNGVGYGSATCNRPAITWSLKVQ